MAAPRRQLEINGVVTPARLCQRALPRLATLAGLLLFAAGCSTARASLPPGTAAGAPILASSPSAAPAPARIASATQVATATQVAEPVFTPSATSPAADPAALEAALSTLEAVPETAATPTPGWANQPAAGVWGASTAPTPAAAQTAGVLPGPKYWGVATYYGADFQGQPMAAGPAFDMRDPTVTASNSWPLGTRLRITRIPGGPWDSLLTPAERQIYFSRSIVVTVMDRGAFTHALDLSWGAFAELGNPAEGVIRVLIEPVDGVPPVKGLRGAPAGPDL